MILYHIFWAHFPLAKKQNRREKYHKNLKKKNLGKKSCKSKKRVGKTLRMTIAKTDHK